MDTKTIDQLDDIRQRAEVNLAGNLVPFWVKHAWDAEHGGFLTRLDRRGRRLDDSEKVLMMQVRMLFSLSAAHRHGIRDQGYLEMANQTFRFLIDHMWDQDEGGFYFSVTREGRPKVTRKNTDFHGYALTGLTEYYRASGCQEALDAAERVFELLMTRAVDRDLGFIEDFDGHDWGALNAEQMNLGDQTRIKTIDMHTNVLEGFLYLCKSTRDPRHRDALRNVLRLIRSKGIHKEHGCTITVFDYEWNPLADAHGRMTTSYGLNVELAWLMLEAVDLLGESREDYRSTILGLVDHALDYGFDHARGGLAALGPQTGHVVDATGLDPNRLFKSWWAQAEMLNALIDAYRWTQDGKYLSAFTRLFEWVWKYQIDHECGDWYQDVHWESGQPVTTDKGREFKTAFHAGRALIRTSEALQSIIQAC